MSSMIVNMIILTVAIMETVARSMPASNTATNHKDNRDCVDKLTNGCSAPSIGKENIYVKKIFLPACTRHDVCYECGQTKGWSQEQCDKAFYENMKAICFRRHRALAYGIIDKMAANIKLGIGLLQWLGISKNSYEHCMHGAYLFYTGVKGYGSDFYGPTLKDKSLCKMPCVDQLGLELVIEVPKYIRLEAIMQYKDKTLGAWDRPLIFKGSITATTTEINLKFTMDNFIYPTPLTEYIAIGNILLKVGYPFGAPFPSMEFGASFKLGKLDPTTTNDEAIQITGKFGLNPANPGENWFYGKVSKLTVNQICVAFKLNCKSVPDSFRSAGFPKGLEVSFSLTEREVDEDIGTIPKGLTLKGTISFMSFKCTFEVSISSTQFKLLLEMSPLNWGGGAIVVARSADDEDKGPMGAVEFSMDGTFSISIKGYCKFLRLIKRSVDITIENRIVKFAIEGSLIPGLFNAHITVDGKFDGSPDMGFKFFGKLQSNDDFQAKLLNAVKAFLTKMKEKAEEVIKTAKESLERAKESVRQAKERVEAWKGSINAWKNNLEKRKAELDEQANKAPPCHCPQKCFPFLRWYGKCWQTWGAWVGCMKVDPCFKMVDDLPCQAACAAKKVVSSVVTFAKKAVLSIASILADGVAALSSVATGVLSLGDGVLSAAQKSLDFVMVGVQWAIDAAVKFLEGILKNFKLYQLTVSASLSVDYSACVEYNISLLFIHNMTATGSISLEGSGFMGGMVKAVTDGPSAPDGLKKDGKSLSSTDETVNEAKGKQDEVNSLEKEMDEQEKKVADKVSTETAKDFKNGAGRDEIATLNKYSALIGSLPKVQTVPTKERMEINELVNKPTPEYIMSEDPDLRGVDRNAPWTALDDLHEPIINNDDVTLKHDVTVINDVTHDNNDTHGSKRWFYFGPTLTPCERTKKALDVYKELVNGLSLHVSHLQKGFAQIRGDRNAEKRFLRNTRRNIEASVRVHNMTKKQMDNAYYLYRKALIGYKKLAQKSNEAIHREESYMMPIFRRQLNTALKERGTSFIDFTNALHVNAVEGYKRSMVPNTAGDEGEMMLSDINKEIQTIVTDEKSNLVSTLHRIHTAKRQIAAIQPYLQHCVK